MPIECNLCGSRRYYSVYKKPRAAVLSAVSPAYAISESHLEKPDKIVRCAACGLVYAIPSSMREIVRDYAEMADPEYLKEEKGRRAQGRVVLKRISRFKRTGKILDIGCGPGFLLDEAKNQGWETAGVDLSAWAKAHSRDHFGIDVFQGSLEEARFPDRTFDAVVMMDVIEHLEDPKRVLKEIRRILKNDGVLYVSTPDIQSFLSRALRARWWGINKYHLFYFSKKTLERLFTAVGFKKLRYASYPRIFTLRYWARRLEAYPAFIHRPVAALAGLGNCGERLLKIVLHDQIDVVARKITRLDSLETGEETKEGSSLKKQKVTAVLPAYNAEKTLERTVADIPRDVVDEIILVDDKSKDRTVAIAKRLNLVVFQHEKNKGYGANQKTCYRRAIERGADVVVMVHPDYQYDPKIIPQLIEPILRGEADAVFGSRMMKGGALEGGMPMWKHNANILLTAFENVMLGTYLTEYHSGFRAYRTRMLCGIAYEKNSDGFLFDTEIIVQILANHYKIDEVPIRTRYFEEASSIKLWPSLLYGLGILKEMFAYVLYSKGILKRKKLEPVTLKDSSSRYKGTR
ncbi:MAG: methyltransferase domain-containing protein [Candidatus Omnitrophica bacterium]|nr:methyltransferase domain-containing protein [Candidatus Omnitrophota bacterium]